MQRLFMLALGFTLFAGCSYNFGSVKRNIPGAYDRVAVPVFKNQTSETGVEVYFTRAMVEEIERGHLAKVTDKEEAQVVLEGKVDKIDYLPGATVDKRDFDTLPTDTVLAKEYRIVLNATLSMRRISDQKVIWTGSFVGERRYPAPLVTREEFNSVNALYNHSSRHQNIEIMVKDMMAEAYSRMTENF